MKKIALLAIVVSVGFVQASQQGPQQQRPSTPKNQVKKISEAEKNKYLAIAHKHSKQQGNN